MEGLTYEDIELLLTAIEAWEKEPMQDGFMGAIIGSMFSQDEDTEKRQESFGERIEKGGGEVEKRKKQAIMLKAKLVTLQDKVAAQEIADEISG